MYTILNFYMYLIIELYITKRQKCNMTIQKYERKKENKLKISTNVTFDLEKFAPKVPIYKIKLEEN